ncbi:MoaD/ThiS family protein [Metasolibacillus sp.]|uniref:MoaD/ThiS family protein n=1 Tax=Metasolibacillus sp. TaxID=2703680 RepID=UPI0025F71A14|nr:MoaD/ThiS family protein [Metasolibacillus sp.]MCT6924276.1 MoaD/ThiS family protein [Metasolibacillus sp.]MCT6940322.1 MoaD/ThiS family protein [Metasolibacillus sp.]
MNEILYFAGAKEWTGKARDEHNFAGKSVSEVWAWLTTEYATIPQEGVRLAVNEEYAMLEDVIESGDVIALIPPVSGG